MYVPPSSLQVHKRPLNGQEMLFHTQLAQTLQVRRVGEGEGEEERES